MKYFTKDYDKDIIRANKSFVSLDYLSFCLQPLDRLCEFRLFCRQQLHVLIHLLHD